MRKYLVTTVVFGLLVLATAIPCLADAGTGIGVACEATVVAGDSGSSGGGYYGGGYKYIEPSQPTATTPISDNATASLPATPTTPTPVTTTPPSQTFPPIPPAVGVPMPTEQGGLGIGGFLLIGLAILCVGFIGWQFVSKRLEKRKEKMRQNETTVR